MDYRRLTQQELDRTLFSHFRRRQVVTRCWRKRAEGWRLEDIAFVDDWSAADIDTLVTCLRNTIETDGAVFGAFDAAGALKGFTSVEACPLGQKGTYLDLSCLHVSEELRGRGIGRTLFGLAGDWARSRGAQKLYISAHSARETQAFYHAMGCVEAQEYNAEHVKKEPCDCQMEYTLQAGAPVFKK